MILTSGQTGFGEEITQAESIKAITYQMPQVCGFVVSFEKNDGPLHCPADTEGVIIR